METKISERENKSRKGRIDLSVYFCVIGALILIPIILYVIGIISFPLIVVALAGIGVSIPILSACVERDPQEDEE